MKLVIVESPTKAKTLSRFLGSDYLIEASMGHLRDLPSNKLGVDVEKEFKPEYVVDEKKKKQVTLLKKSAKGKKQVILATDPDREGEAIAYHVRYLLGDKLDFQRIVFHEITKKAVEEALEQPGKIDMDRVEAQQARRILDRLVGYNLSPVLWRKVRRGLSAGRVQSVAVRLVVEREAEIEAFRPKAYWEVEVELKKDKKILVKLNKIDTKRAVIEDKELADEVVGDLKAAKYEVADLKTSISKRSPLPPLITSTMQRVASNVLGWSAKKTMRMAQSLYEKGLITYHRTDSVSLSNQAISQTRKYVEEKYGKEYLPETEQRYKTKSKTAQRAHEAIRPTKVKIEQVEDKTANRLYQLIWQRMVGSQMKPAEVEKIKLIVKASSKKTYQLVAEKESLKFAGWYKATGSYKEKTVDWPELTVNDKLELVKVLPERKETLPPPRYSEAALIKELEKRHIGRPSTYAPILSTIQDRQYVEKVERSLKPTSVGTTVTKFLLKYFKKVMDYDFTAKMEDDLDKVAEKKLRWQKLLKDFYFPFDIKVKKVIEKAKRVKIEVEKTGNKCPKCKKGKEVIRVGRFGKFLSCSSFPDCKYTANYKQVVDEVKCPECKAQVVIKKSKKGKQFFGCDNYPKCKWASWRKPK